MEAAAPAMLAPSSLGRRQLLLLPRRRVVTGAHAIRILDCEKRGHSGQGKEDKDVNSLVCKNRCAGKHRKLSRFGSRPGLPNYLEPDHLELSITLPGGVGQICAIRHTSRARIKPH
uniref:Uncharacterized protein n=1 Tax=Oryza sativa subsp. japonica TaxID=39947 RepID=Q6K5K8_ORYSJ|nr:hypothetical protein [Oryza sativa Japonica Group]BAD22120.1 hypothetical protein [Oryza sativa Japonica Group]